MMMEWFGRWIAAVIDWLAWTGLPEENRVQIAWVLLGILAALAVVLIIALGVSLVRRGKAPPEVEEEPGPPVPPPMEMPPEREIPLAEEEPAVPEEEVSAPAEEGMADREVGIPLPEEKVSLRATEAPAPEVEAPPPVEQMAPPAPAPEPEVEMPVPVEELPPVVEEAPARVSLFDRMRVGLAKTKTSLVGRIDDLLSGSSAIDEDLLEELEEVLVSADFGMKTTTDLMQSLEKRIGRGEAKKPEALRALLKEEIHRRLQMEASPLNPESSAPFVIMVVGVNGVGKTTTIGKIAHQFVEQGKTVLLGAGDTFRAAAAEQLTIWGERAGVNVISQKAGSDPAAVAFDAIKAALARKVDVLILDTAGRLHTKVNLMEELKKIRKVLDRELPGAPHETLLVVDATTGQNALVQAKLFQEAVAVTGLALTKLDGTARGGMIVAIGNELGLPVRYVGIGEGIDDLRPFDPTLFVEALFER
ncbi:MAG: signal recognition particle-docking protein FtsY [Syntrophotaleaceae bacterium]